MNDAPRWPPLGAASYEGFLRAEVILPPFREKQFKRQFLEFARPRPEIAGKLAGLIGAFGDGRIMLPESTLYARGPLQVHRVSIGISYVTACLRTVSGQPVGEVAARQAAEGVRRDSDPAIFLSFLDCGHRSDASDAWFLREQRGLAEDVESGLIRKGYLGVINAKS